MWKPGLLVVLVILLATLLFGAVHMQTRFQIAEFENSPYRQLTISVPPSSREQFLVQMKKFGEENGFSQEIRPIHTVKPEFGVDLWRRDVALFGDNLRGHKVFVLRLYVNKKQPISHWSADSLIEKLANALQSIPDVTVSLTQP